MQRFRKSSLSLVLTAVLLAAVWVTWPRQRGLAQTSMPGATSAPATTAAPAAAASGPVAALPEAQNVIAYLNQSIDWHRGLSAEEQAANDPSDVLFVNQDQQSANQVLRLAFDFARADAQLLAQDESASKQKTAPPPTGYQQLYTAAQAADEEVRQTQAELQADKNKLATGRAADRPKLQATIDELQSELELAQTRSKTLHDVLQFVSGASGTGGNLAAQIDELQRSVPELEAEAAKSRSSPASSSGTPIAAEPGNAQTPAANSTASATVNAASARRSQPSGLLDLAEDMFSLSHKIHTLEQRQQATDVLAQSAQKLRAPLVGNLTAVAARGEEAAKQADTSDPAQLAQLKHELDSLTASFKQASSVVLPLSKQAVIFDLYKNNLARWRSAVQSQYSADMRRLLLRGLLFGFVLALVIVLAQVWRRAVFRYVHDARRRYQFLLLRRIILWCCIGITVAFALATEIGSIATFAGLITAGIAVALQNVILAIAGYFFLIGKYGVRVGDRVQISDVTGDVIDIGLIRLHLIEVGGTETDRQPTGRVVVFSNAIVFQPSASFYKQIPGTSFVWHEVSLMLAPESDYAQAEKRMVGAVEKVYGDYRERIAEQHREMERTLSIAVALPKPHSRLRLTQTGLEVVIRYPVELASAAEIDDRITRELLHALEQSPKLKLVGSGVPNIQPVTEEKAA